MRKHLFVILGLLALALSAQAAEIDMSQFTCAVITAKAEQAMSPDIPYLNEIELRNYATAINNWKLNRDQGHAGPIPDPPLKWILVVDYAKCSAWVTRSSEPVIAKYVEPVPDPPPSKAGAIVPPFLPGRYLCVMGDTAPEGYVLTLADGTKVKKIINLSPFGPMPEYQTVK